MREFVVAPENDSLLKNSKFAALVLDDDTIGLTFVALDQAQHDLNRLNIAAEVQGSNPLALCAHYAEHCGWQRTLGMAAINAVCRWLFRQSGYTFDAANKTANTVDFKESDTIGMVGYFPPLVEQIKALGIPLTVIELNESLMVNEANFRVTDDSTALNHCSKVICTGTTLINHTIDHILDQCGNVDEIHVIGPSTGCLPDPLFARGVTSVGGRLVSDSQRFLEQWRCDKSWKSVSNRYCIVAKNYPGYQQLLRNVSG